MSKTSPSFTFDPQLDTSKTKRPTDFSEDVPSVTRLLNRKSLSNLAIPVPPEASAPTGGTATRLIRRRTLSAPPAPLPSASESLAPLPPETPIAQNQKPEVRKTRRPRSASESTDSQNRSVSHPGKTTPPIPSQAPAFAWVLLERDPSQEAWQTTLSGSHHASPAELVAFQAWTQSLRLSGAQIAPLLTASGGKPLGPLSVENPKIQILLKALGLTEYPQFSWICPEIPAGGNAKSPRPIVLLGHTGALDPQAFLRWATALHSSSSTASTLESKLPEFEIPLAS